MTKSVELSETVFGWIQRHSFISEEVIIGIILHTPESERIYADDAHFRIQFFRNNNRHTLEITLWTHEQETKFLVYGAHSEKLRHKR